MADDFKNVEHIAKYNVTLPTYSDEDPVQLQTDENGRLINKPKGSQDEDFAQEATTNRLENIPYGSEDVKLQQDSANGNALKVVVNNPVGSPVPVSIQDSVAGTDIGGYGSATPSALNTETDIFSSAVITNTKTAQIYTCTVSSLADVVKWEIQFGDDIGGYSALATFFTLGADNPSFTMRFGVPKEVVGDGTDNLKVVATQLRGSLSDCYANIEVNELA